MKIEEKNLNNFLAALLNLPGLANFPMNTTQPGNSSSDFKSMLSEIKGVGCALRTSSSSGAQCAPYIEIESMTKEDIEFFKLCLENKELTINNISPKNMRIDFTTLQDGQQQVSYKSVNFSKGLFNLIEYSFKTQKPVRLDFQGNSSVILRIGNEGKLTAEFISSDAAMEYALKSGIPALKQKMDSENIPYQDIYYKDSDKKQNNKKKKDKGDGK